MKKFFNTLNFIILALFTVLITFFRVIQLKFLTDFNTACDNFKTYDLFGFNFSSKVLTYFIYGFIIVYFLFLAFFIFFKNNSGFVLFYNIKSKSNKIINFSLILFAILMVLCSVLYIKDLSNIKSKSYGIIASSFISQILFAVYFIYIAYCFFSDNFSKKSYLNIILVFPIFWGLVRMLGVIFLTCFSLLTPREFLFNNLKVAFYTMFLVCLGKVFMGASFKNNERCLILFGNLSLFFGLNSLIPRIIVYFTSLNSTLVSMNPTYDYNINIFRGTNFMILDFVIMLFIALILFRYMLFWKKETEDLKID